MTLPEGEFIYRRLEPVPPTELVPRHVLSPGEGLERLVVRSNAGVSAEEYAAASLPPESDPLALIDPSMIYHAYCDRHVAPAKTSLQLAEVHGMFDEAIAVVQGLSPEDAASAVEQFYKIAARENGSFHDYPAPCLCTLEALGGKNKAM